MLNKVGVFREHKFDLACSLAFLPFTLKQTFHRIYLIFCFVELFGRAFLIFEPRILVKQQILLKLNQLSPHIQQPLPQQLLHEIGRQFLPYAQHIAQLIPAHLPVILQIPLVQGSQNNRVLFPAHSFYL